MNDVGIQLSASNKLNPNEFDQTTNALLVGVGAEKYVQIFKKHNIGQCTLTELTDGDLVKLGVDDAEIRQKIMSLVETLPSYKENEKQIAKDCNLTLPEIIDVLEDCSLHLHRMYLSILANTRAVKKTKKITDCLLYKDKYSSDISLATLSEINTILNSMDIGLHTKFKVYSETNVNVKKKKIIVGTLGSVVIAVLTVMFVDSLKKLKD